jgi:hypothetical protein
MICSNYLLKTALNKQLQKPVIPIINKEKNMKKFLLAVLICLFSFTAQAAKTIPDAPSTKALTDSVMTLVSKGNLDSSYALLSGYWAPPAADFKKLVDASAQQRGQMAIRYGKTIGSEFLKTEVLGQSFIRHIYLEKFETHAVRWIFTFYKPRDAWVLNAVLWDDQIYALF